MAATRIAHNVIAFASTIVLARLLVPADFGLVAIASTVAMILSSITELSLAHALVQHRDPQEHHFHSAFSLNLGRSALLAVLMCGLAWPVASVFGDNRLAPIMIVLGLATLFAGAVNPKLVVFSRNLVFWQDFAVLAAQKLVGFVVAIAIAITWRSYWALIGGVIASQLCATAVSYLIIPYRPRLQLAGARELLSFSGWLMLGQAVNTLNWRADHLAIGYVLGNQPLGYYTVGDNLAVLPTREATTPLAQTLFPAFSRMQEDRSRLRDAYKRAQTALFALALPAGFGFALVAEPLVQLAMGEKWLPAVIVIQFLAGIFALQTLATTVQPLAMSLGETRMLFNRDLITFAVRIPLIIVGLVLGGLPGVVYARCVSGTFGTVLNLGLARRLLDLPISEQLRLNLRPIASTLIMALATWWVGVALGNGTDNLFLATKILVMVAVGAGAYFSTIYVLWRLSGRPLGPESEAVELMSSTVPKLFAARGRDAA